ncbi:hypothetical protein, partial [Campylobacter concisus]
MRVFKYVRDILSLLKRETFIDYIFFYVRSVSKVKQLSKIDLSNISKYFKENSNFIRSNRNILVEFFSDYPIMVHNICNFKLLLENLGATNSIALL